MLVGVVLPLSGNLADVADEYRKGLLLWEETVNGAGGVLGRRVALKLLDDRSEATQAAKDHPSEPVPLHLRGAPTPLMKGLGYGEGYQYAHDHPGAYVPQEYLPDSLKGARWYAPSEFGYEKTVKERMEWWERIKREAAQ